jgi:hypothetical protein
MFVRTVQFCRSTVVGYFEIKQLKNAWRKSRSTDPGSPSSRTVTRSWTDVVRQQWNFSPPSSVDEREDYKVDLPDATALELTIKPDISGGEAHASLQQLQVAVRTRG